MDGLLGMASGLVTAILEALGEVRNAEEKTNKLLDTVEKAQSSLRHLQNRSDGQPLWEGLDASLKVLGEELDLAMEKVQQNVESNQQRAASNRLVETARSIIGRGASQQNQETLAIIQKLEEALANLDRNVKYSVAANNQALLGIQARPSGPLPHPEHELVKRMLTLASGVDEILDLQVAVSLGNSWVDPSKSKYQAVRESEASKKRKRGARKGGYEVPNPAKVRFSMSVSLDDKWYFYILTSDRWANAEPQVFFPEFANNVMINEVSSGYSRIFPNHELHPRDPISLKVERSKYLPCDTEGQVSIFLVVTTTQLKKDGLITIQDIDQHMNSVKEDELIVKHIPFDILVAE